MSKEDQDERKKRLETELPVLYAVDYTDYFIMLYMLAKEARRRKIPIGYSRGSGANCLCLFMLNVTQIDSVRWGLDFSRFANLGRKSMADFDWDISKRRRKEMVEISEELFGKENVAPICTFNSLSTKVAIRDIGKVLDEKEDSPYYKQIPYKLRDDVAKMIPTIKTLNDLGEEEEKDVLLKDILSKNPKLDEIYNKFPLGEENKLGQDIYERKYQFNGETFDQWLDRVSGGNEEVKQLIKDKKFLFGGRILANRGVNKNIDVGDDRYVKTTLSNCYVITPPDDNIESIFDCAKKLARTYSYGGGCGIDISKLAPRGSVVRNSAKTTTGSVSFMDLYSLITGLICQQGRRGALMISLSCEHPDLEEFIGIKSDLDKVTKANISVRITDKFMAAVKNKQPFTLSFTRTETGETITKTIDAYEMFHKLCEMNWDYAEPGMLFWDRIENWNLLSCDDNFHYAGTNPCAWVLGRK